MNRRREVVVLCLAWALFVAAAGASDHSKNTVPPSLELQILDPNVDPVGNPTAIPHTVAPGLAQIDIPATVIVHRYYYTGDRSFQGPFLKGGPCTIVAHHPRTGERVYVPVQMLPGAPRITYRHHSIDYDFGKHGITVCFGLACGRPTVEYRNCPTVSSTMKHCAEKTKTCSHDLLERTGLPTATRKVVAAGKNVTYTVMDQSQDVAKMAITPAIQAFKLLPGANLLSSPPEELATRERDRQIDRLQTIRKNSNFDASIPSGR